MASDPLPPTDPNAHAAEPGKTDMPHLEEAQLLRTLIDSLPDYIFVKDTAGRFVLTNQAVADRFGAASPADLVGKSDFDFLPPAIAAQFYADEQALFHSGQPLINHEEYNENPSGEPRWFLATKIPLRDRAGAIVGLVGNARDITEWKAEKEERTRLERKLQESQHVESLGRLASGVAHDFNNLLGAILGNAGLARLDTPPDSPAQTSLEQLEHAAWRAAELVRQLLAYSGQGGLNVRPVNLTTLVEEMEPLFRSVVPVSTHLEYHLDDQLPMVNADATQLRQVVTNLVSNAAEAIGEQDGMIRVSTCVAAADRLAAPQIPVDEPPLTGYYVCLEVADSGPGIDAETRSRMFEPFFTTKFMGRGLGLPAALGIVRSHHGTLHVASTPGQGTTFTILLPALAADEQTSSASAE